jgi:hypothetical protein
MEPLKSATASVQVLENPQFCGKAGPRTLFTIKVSQAVDVARLSAIGAEDERLILPGTMFEVKSSMDAGGGLRIVQVEQVEGAPSLIAGVMPSADPASAHPSAKGQVSTVAARLTNLWVAIVLTLCHQMRFTGPN